jgi:hypothetical protein
MEEDEEGMKGYGGGGDEEEKKQGMKQAKG